MPLAVFFSILDSYALPNTWTYKKPSIAKRLKASSEPEARTLPSTTKNHQKPASPSEIHQRAPKELEPLTPKNALRLQKAMRALNDETDVSELEEPLFRR